MRQLSLSRWFFVAALIGVLTGCGGAKKDAYIEKPVDDLYNQAMDQMVEERYAAAAATFEQVESQHPYSVWATKAQLMAAYARYESGDYDEAIISADRFIQLHPGNRDVAYAYYLKAISYYVQIVDVGRDQKITEEALKALEDVIHRFPDTKYARDAKLKTRFHPRPSRWERDGNRSLLPQTGPISGGDEPLQASCRQLSDDDACPRGSGAADRMRFGARPYRRSQTETRRSLATTTRGTNGMATVMSWSTGPAIPARRPQSWLGRTFGSLF